MYQLPNTKKMKVLIIGNGGRESAVAKKLAQDKRITQLYFAKGNATTETLGKNLPFDDVVQLRDFVIKEKIDFTGVNQLQKYTSIEGSGGDYLSNEIFYRISRLRTKLNPSLATGHLHVSKIQSGKNDIEYSDTDTLINKVKNVIEISLSSL